MYFALCTNCYNFLFHWWATYHFQKIHQMYSLREQNIQNILVGIWNFILLSLKTKFGSNTKGTTIESYFGIFWIFECFCLITLLNVIRKTIVLSKFIQTTIQFPPSILSYIKKKFLVRHGKNISIVSTSHFYRNGF